MIKSQGRFDEIVSEIVQNVMDALAVLKPEREGVRVGHVARVEHDKPRFPKASFYDPEINRTYGAMAAHYSVGVLPARPGKPRDKAKVEAGVRVAQNRILGRLRGLTFFSLAECNAAIALVMQRMNDRPMRNSA